MSKTKGWVGTVVSTRMVETITERQDIVAARPKFKTGDYVRIYYGRDEDHCFTVSGVRYHEATRWHSAGFQYARAMINGTGWLWEDAIVAEGDRSGWHYDRQGYCDNPGRGY